MAMRVTPYETVGALAKGNGAQGERPRAPGACGVYGRGRVSFRAYGQAARRYDSPARAANRPRASRPAGMRGGRAEPWARVERGPRLAERKSESRKLSP